MVRKKHRGQKLVMRIHLKVREVAVSRNMEAAKLSRLADLNYATVLALFNKPDRDVSILTLEKVARVLGADVSELYEVQNDTE